MPPVDFVRGGWTGNKSREQIMKKISRAAAARHDDQKMRKGVLEIRRSKESEEGRKGGGLELKNSESRYTLSF